MKRFRLLCLVMFTLLVGVLLLWWTRDRESRPLHTPTIPASSRTQAVGEGTSVHKVSTGGTTTAVAIGQAHQAYREGKVGKVDVMQSIWNAENEKNLVFYGKLVDQYGSPVSGAKVIGSTMVIAGMDETRSRVYETLSDDTGCFSFQEARGVRLGVFPSKQGYEFNRKFAKANWSEDYIPDPMNPIVFQMWRLQGPERLIEASNSRTLVIKNAQPSLIDLKHASKVQTGGEMRVIYQCDATTAESYSNYKQVPYDWNVTLEIPDGGFVPIKYGTYPYVAPTTGYNPTLRIEMPRTETNWCERFTGAYYIQIAGGKQYGRMEVEVLSSPKWQHGEMYLKVHLNPWGSKNLEYDVDRPFDPFRPEKRW